MKRDTALRDLCSEQQASLTALLWARAAAATPAHQEIDVNLRAPGGSVPVSAGGAVSVSAEAQTTRRSGTLFHASRLPLKQ
jgi:hypothetical protein